jgi:hypothetical protein
MIYLFSKARQNFILVYFGLAVRALGALFQPRDYTFGVKRVLAHELDHFFTFFKIVNADCARFLFISSGGAVLFRQQAAQNLRVRVRQQSASPACEYTSAQRVYNNRKHCYFTVQRDIVAFDLCVIVVVKISTVIIHLCV